MHRSSPRRAAPFFARLLVAILAIGTLASAPARAQRPDSTRRADSASVRRDTVPAARPVRAAAPAVADTLEQPLSARRAFFYSALIPGLGQTKLDRGRAGAVFFTTEIISIAMAFKSAGDLRFARAHAKDSVVATYELNPDGTAKLDSLGLAVPATFAPNRYAAARVRARRTHVEDWYALLIFNHLISGAEAFVSAQLWDFPAKVSIQARPRGGDIGVTIPW